MNLIFSLRALELVLCPNPDSLDPFNLTPSRRLLRPHRHLPVTIPFGFTTCPPLSLSSTFFKTIPSLIQHLAKPHNLADQQQTSAIRHGPRARDTQNGFSGAPMPSADFGLIMLARGDCLSDLDCQPQNNTHLMCEVHAGHLFHFSVAQSPKRREGHGTALSTLSMLVNFSCATVGDATTTPY